MKKYSKITSVLLALILLIGVMPLSGLDGLEFFAPKAEAYSVDDKIQYGDINADGKVDATDARLALRVAAKLDTLTDVQKKIADIDGNGEVNAIDARKILRIAAKLEPAPVSTSAVSTGMPSGVSDILEFYRKAVKRVKNGEAGYNKKSWQTIPELNLTGNASIDKQVVNIASGYMTSEADAETQVNAKGSGDATGRMPDCTLTDLSKIKSADCVADGSNYKITIVMNDEIAPDAKDASYIAQISDNLAFKADIDETLGGISILKDPDYVITYTNFTITATITPDGQFVSMTHHNTTKIHVNSAKILFITFYDKDITMTADSVFDTFRY